MMAHIKGGGALLALLTLVLLGWAGSAPAADVVSQVRDQEIKQTLRLRKGSSKVLRIPFPITRISVANPDVADIVLISEKEIYVNGLSPGATNLSLWGKSRFTSVTVTVEADVSLLKEKLHQILPKEKIAVESANDSIILSGEVSSPVAQQTAISVAAPFVDKREKIINLLQVGGVQQVMVEVKVAEINRNVAERMGINFFAFNRSTNEFLVSQINQLAPVRDLIRGFGGTSFTAGMSTALTAVAGFKTGNVLWTMFFDVLKRNGLGKVLAEPNLVTTSGQSATFWAGGEFPIPVPQGFGTTTIEFKKFGILLAFTPTVLDEGKIAMKITPEVSELDFTAGVSFTSAGFLVPGLKMRQTSTHVELRDGQTFAISGLISDNHRNIIDKFPILGDIPIIGTLFRSANFQKNETELVILATPRLVKPMTSTTQARLPTDKYIEPSMLEFYLLGSIEGSKAKPKTPPPAPQSLPDGFGRQSMP